MNTFGKMLSTNAESSGTNKYTGEKIKQQDIGHYFRRFFASLLVYLGTTITEIKKHGGLKFTTVAEGYIGQSITHKKTTEERIIPSASSSITVALSTLLQKLTANADEIINLASSN